VNHVDGSVRVSHKPVSGEGLTYDSDYLINLRDHEFCFKHERPLHDEAALPPDIGNGLSLDVIDQMFLVSIAEGSIGYQRTRRVHARPQ
jgi:hypothetical protein